MTQLQDVNQRDLLGAIALGCETMGRVFDADDPVGVPFFDAVAWPEPRLSFSPMHSEAHVPGRHLHALLSAEAFAGVVLDESVIERLTRALAFSYDGPLPLPMNRARRDGPVENVCPHNVREGLHGLVALARWRSSAWAAEMAERSIATIERSWSATEGWRIPVDGDCADLTLCQGLGRAIGPMVRLWRITGSERALDLARRIAAALLERGIPDDGRLDTAVLGTHVHSITSTLSSLALLGDALDDERLLDRVRAFLDHGLWSVRDALGWVVEVADPAAPADKGEANSSGDLVETLLILGRRGVLRHDEDAERIVRAHLMPSQLRDVAWIPASAGLDDGTRAVADRLRGAWGFPAPYGHAPLGLSPIKFNLDIVGGTVASLAAVAEAAVQVAQDGAVRVRFAFDGDWAGGRVRVRSPYATGGRIEVDAPGAPAIHVRVPAWAGEAGWRTLEAGVAVVATGMPTHQLVLYHAARSIGVRLQGDEVVAMDDVGADHTFFPAA